MSQETPSLMARLRDATADLHRHAESRPLQRQMFEGTIARDAFAAYLGQLYLIHSRLESALERAGTRDESLAAIERPERRHAGRLVDDLEHFGVAPDSVVPTTGTERFLAHLEELEGEKPIALLGPFYVLEGSTNGSRVLAKVLARVWRSADGRGLSYLDPYGEEQRSRWAAFKREVDALDLGETEQGAVIDAARGAFRAIADISDEVALRCGGETAPAPGGVV